VVRQVPEEAQTRSTGLGAGVVLAGLVGLVDAVAVVSELAEGGVAPEPVQPTSTNPTMTRRESLVALPHLVFLMQLIS
jgi:Na+-transporting methylmalonyl-CoA/oxaloacetate decarboxylase gamma subunit